MHFLEILMIYLKARCVKHHSLTFEKKNAAAEN